MMTSLPKISQADLEKLNTYLDGALSLKEKAEFEVKLAKSLPLQSVLREYTILRNALRSVPPKKAPHHFTLTTAEAQQTKRPVFLAPIFSFASLVTVMLLAIVFASDWIFKNMSAPAAPAPVEAPMAARMSEPAEQSVEIKAATDAPLIFNWGYGQVGGLGGLGGGGSEMAMGMGGAPDSGMAYGTEIINPAVLNEDAMLKAAEAPSISAEPSLEPAPAPLPANYVGAVIWGLMPDSEGEIIEVYPSATGVVQPEVDAFKNQAESTSQDAAQPADAPYQTAPWIKYSLAGLTLLFGLLAFFFSRRMN
jgi:hypothetical protein